MKVSEIYTSALRQCVESKMPLSDEEQKALAQAELDRRGEKAVEGVVKYWRHLTHYTRFKTVNGVCVKSDVSGFIGKELMMDVPWMREITAEDYGPAPMEAAKPASGGKSCANCALDMAGHMDCLACKDASKWQPKPAPPAKPDALDREIATEEYMNDEGKAEPVEPLPFLNDRTDDLPIVIRRMNLFLNVVNELHRKHDALEAVVREIRKERAG